MDINTNIPSLIAQQNLNANNSSLNTAITRLSSGKRINSAADDAAGLAVVTTMTTQENGLNQGIQNANNGVTLVQTIGSALSSLTSSLQRIYQLANEALQGTLTPANQQALQQEVMEQKDEINRIASTTQYNGINLLNGAAGVLQVQVGANVGQTVLLNLTQGVSAASLGGGVVQAGVTLGTVTDLNLNANGSEASGTGAITEIHILSDGNGGFTFEDQNNAAISTTASSALFTVTTTNGISSLSLNSTGTDALLPTNDLASINAAITADAATASEDTVFGKISGIDLDASTGLDATAGASNVITTVSVESDGKGGVKYVDQNGTQLSSGATAGLFNTAAGGTISFANTPTSTIGSTQAGVQPAGSVLAEINQLNVPTTVSQIDVSTSEGANNAINSVQNALATIANMQASLGAVQNRFTAIAQTQQAQSTDLATAASGYMDADFAQETANLSKTQVLVQASISVVAQANALPQQVLKLLQ
jgi:flagellin